MKVVNLTILFIFLLQTPIFAQQETAFLDNKTKAEIIQTLGKSLSANYIFPKKAEEIDKKLKSLWHSGYFNKFTDVSSFANELTIQMRLLANDKHLGVKFKDEPPMTDEPPMMDEPPRRIIGSPDGNPNLPPPQRMPGRIRRDGNQPNDAPFVKADILANNIGYLSLKGFGEGKEFFQAIDEAMTKLANTDAIIIELRENRGGSPRGSQYLASYFFNAKSTQLSSVFRRENNKEKEEQFWTVKVAGKPYLKKPVYILTGTKTFSAAENFAYDMQALKRATIIGETSGGGANPGREFPLGCNFFTFIPTGRSYNYVTKTNWEGVGVKPDFPTKENEAMEQTLQIIAKR